MDEKTGQRPKHVKRYGIRYRTNITTQNARGFGISKDEINNELIKKKIDMAIINETNIKIN